MLPLPKTTKPDPLVIRVLRDYRARMDGKETALMDAMGKRWLLIEQKLNKDISLLAYEFERRQRFGETITQQMIWKAERYQIIKAQLQDEVRKYNRDYAVSTIAAAQEQYATLGIEAANAAITASYPGAGALSRSWTRINTKAVESMIGMAGDGSPLYSLLKNDYPDAVDGLTNALINGLARGKGPAQIAKDMADGMGMGMDRALLIARTEAARAYRTASAEQYRQSGVVVAMKRLVKKETACVSCLLLDGEIIPIGEELTEHPRGKCTVVPCLEGVNAPTWQTGKDWFLLQSEIDQQRIMGADKWRLWKENNIPLARFAQHTHNDVWGDSPRVATNKELMK